MISFPTYHILIYQKGSLGIHEDSIFLSIHFILEDENGLEDIEEILITHIETDYMWKLPNNIIQKEVIFEEKSYRGYSFLEYDNGKSILTGDYLIEVRDKAGNSAESAFVVEIEGLILNKPYELPNIDYHISKINNKEIKITPKTYNSCEIKVMDKPGYFNGGRKKFKNTQKLIIDKNPLEKDTKLSVKINHDKEENIIYFLSDFIIN